MNMDHLFAHVEAQKARLAAIASACDPGRLLALCEYVNKWAKEEWPCETCNGSGVLFDQTAFRRSRWGHPDNREPEDAFSDPCEVCDGEGWRLP